MKYKVTLRQYIYYELEIDAAGPREAMSMAEKWVESGDAADDNMTEYDNGDLEVIYAIDPAGNITEAEKYV